MPDFMILDYFLGCIVAYLQVLLHILGQCCQFAGIVPYFGALWHIGALSNIGCLPGSWVLAWHLGACLTFGCLPGIGCLPGSWVLATHPRLLSRAVGENIKQIETSPYGSLRADICTETIPQALGSLDASRHQNRPPPKKQGFGFGAAYILS